ncbi:MAG: GAF domain-containing sensor histidine kinase [Anaerolineae bacterium]|nr:GAF domain-containing sensor histidine kinase [Anaerolineae bacterium]
MVDSTEADRLSLLYQFAHNVSQQNQAEKILECLVIHTQRYYQADAASIIWIEENDTQVFRAIHGTLSEQLIGLRFPHGEGITGWVAETGECVWIPDVTQNNQFFGEVDLFTGFQTNSILAAPIYRADEIVGVVEIINPGTPIDLGVEKQLLQALAMTTIQAYDQKLALAELSRFGDIFVSHIDPCMTVAQDGLTVDINGAARILFSLQSDNQSHIHFDELGIADNTFVDIVNTLPDNAYSRWNFVQGDDETKTYQATLTQVEDANPPVYYVHIRDISEFVALGDSRLRLFNMLVHDLRVPLGSIHHSIELVMTAVNEGDTTIPVNQVLEIALRSEHRMERLISDILDTTRLNSQTKMLHFTDINLYDMAQEAMNIIITSAQRRNHTLNTKLQPGLQPLSGDQDLLQRVLINILGNAVKYTPDGGKIDFNIFDDEQNVYFEISDNGPGILPADEAHIFELFFRGHSNRVKGAGIGLAFSKLAVEAHGGRIWLEHQAHQGAKLVFSIPKVLPDSAILLEEHP